MNSLFLSLRLRRSGIVQYVVRWINCLQWRQVQRWLGAAMASIMCSFDDHEMRYVARGTLIIKHMILALHLIARICHRMQRDAILCLSSSWHQHKLNHISKPFTSNLIYFNKRTHLLQRNSSILSWCLP